MKKEIDSQPASFRFIRYCYVNVLITKCKRDAIKKFRVDLLLNNVSVGEHEVVHLISKSD